MEKLISLSSNTNPFLLYIFYMKFKLFSSLFVLVLTFFSCSEQMPVDVKKSTSLRIVSLVPSYTSEIVELGFKDNIVGATSYCEISKENKVLIVGSVIDINEEKILLLKPDVVFASTLVKEKSIETLKNNGINVQFLGKMESFDDLCSQFLKLGEILDVNEKANLYIESAKQRIDSLKNLVPKTDDTTSVFFQLGASPICTVIPNTFMDDFITFSGCKNAFYDLNKIIINRESVLLRNPDYIIISSMGDIGEQEKQVWQGYTELVAVRDNRIFVVESASTPTIKNFLDNFEYIIKKMYFSGAINE